MENELFNRLLEYYGISLEEYQNLTKPVTVDNFAEGHSFKNMGDAVKLVKTAIENKDKIFIYGDYDADGIMGTSILVKGLSKITDKPSFYIPNRYHDGYGITIDKAKEVCRCGVKLVVTVDNGVSAFEPIAYLKKHGVKVLILDHHTIQETLPNADVIIHPQYSEFGDIPTSAAFTAFMFIWALLGKFDKYLSTLAAISLISDMMPLKGYNRNFLRLVFANFKGGEFEAIDLLRDGEKFDENAIGMKIAPKINALGRMVDSTDINCIIDYFTQDDPEILYNLSTWINQVNDERKKESRIAQDKYSHITSEEPALVIATEAKEGIIGLVANNLCNNLHLPVIVFTKDKEHNILKGSCRAPEGFNVVDAFNSLSNLTLTAGGHALAGGCSINMDDYDEFANRFIAYAKANPIKPVEHKEIIIRISEITHENYSMIQTFSPFGENWKAPTFILKRIKTSALLFSKTGDHILTYIGQGAKLTGFNFPHNEVTQMPYVDLVGKLKTSIYRGMLSLDYMIKEVRLAEK